MGKVNLGCTWGGKAIAFIELSEEMEDVERLAVRLKEALDLENAKRMQKDMEKIAYRITTAPNLDIKHEAVAKKEFRLKGEGGTESVVGGIFFSTGKIERASGIV